MSEEPSGDKVFLARFFFVKFKIRLIEERLLELTYPTYPHAVFTQQIGPPWLYFIKIKHIDFDDPNRIT